MERKPTFLHVRLTCSSDRKTWYGNMREEDAVKNGFEDRRVELTWLPNGLKEEDVWLCALAYRHNDVDSKEGIWVNPIRRLNSSSEIDEAKRAIEQAKLRQKSSASFAQEIIDLGNGRHVQTEIRVGSGPLARSWTVFETVFNKTKILGVVNESLTGAIQGIRAGRYNFIVENLEEAIQVLGTPNFRSDPDWNGAIATWIDRTGRKLEAIVSVETLVKFAKDQDITLTDLHEEYGVLSGEIEFRGLAQKAIVCHVMLAHGERRRKDLITPARLFELTTQLSTAHRQQINHAMRDLNLICSLNEHEQDRDLELLQSSAIRLRRLRTLTFEAISLEKKDVSLLADLLRDIETEQNRLKQAISAPLSYSTHRGPAVYMQLDEPVKNTTVAEAAHKLGLKLMNRIEYLTLILEREIERQNPKMRTLPSVRPQHLIEETPPQEMSL